MHITPGEENNTVAFLVIILKNTLASCSRNMNRGMFVINRLITGIGSKRLYCAEDRL